MNPMWRNVIMWTVMGLVLGGCYMTMPAKTPVAAASEPAQPEQARYLSQMAVRDESARPVASGVDVALEWSNKYAQASEKVVELTAKNQELVSDNRQLGGQAARLEIDLQNTRQQLTEANTMLVEVRGELEKWKANVLGFRDEIRQAQQAQLEALGRIIKLLEGEAPAPAAKPAPAPAETPDHATQP
jgi:chromosome segregation ATPase